MRDWMQPVNIKLVINQDSILFDSFHKIKIKSCVILRRDIFIPFKRVFACEFKTIVKR